MESNSKVLELQRALPGFGVSYSGPTDGLVGPEFINAVKNLEKKIEGLVGEPVSILSGNNVNMSAGAIAKKYFAGKFTQSPIKPQEPQESLVAPVESKDNDVIKGFQKLLSSQGLYSGAIDGKISGGLITAAQSLEKAISDQIGGKQVSGMIWNSNSKSFATTVEDVESALKLLNSTKTSHAKAREIRFLKLSKILHQMY